MASVAAPGGEADLHRYAVRLQCPAGYQPFFLAARELLAIDVGKARRRILAAEREAFAVGIPLNVVDGARPEGIAREDGFERQGLARLGGVRGTAAEGRDRDRDRGQERTRQPYTLRNRR